MNNPNAIGVLGPMMSERSVRDQQMQREFGGCGSVETYCGRAGVGAGDLNEPRTARDMAMLREFNTCGGVNEGYCNGYMSRNSYNDIIVSPYAQINDNPYLPNGGRVQYVGLK